MAEVNLVQRHNIPGKNQDIAIFYQWILLKIFVILCKLKVQVGAILDPH
jgi:hypothetical protein